VSESAAAVIDENAAEKEEEIALLPTKNFEAALPPFPPSPLLNVVAAVSPAALLGNEFEAL
jgi:hypothetical protein